MKGILRYPKLLKLVVLSALLSIILLVGTSISQAQDDMQWEDNFPVQNQPVNQFVPQSVLPGEDNSPGQFTTEDLPEAKPDVVITDPDTNVPDLIGQLTGGGGISVVIPAADFVADGSNREWFFGFNSSYIYPNSSAGYCGVAPLYLPNGVTVTALVTYVYDNDVAQSVTTYVYAKPLGNTVSASTIATVSTEVQSTSLQILADTSINDPSVINNALYTYHVGVCMWGSNSDSRFYAALVSYLP